MCDVQGLCRATNESTERTVSPALWRLLVELGGRSWCIRSVSWREHSVWWVAQTEVPDVYSCGPGWCQAVSLCCEGASLETLEQKPPFRLVLPTVRWHSWLWAFSPSGSKAGGQWTPSWAGAVEGSLSQELRDPMSSSQAGKQNKTQKVSFLDNK